MSSLEKTRIHPDYLDDDGAGERCFLRHTLAANAGEAEKIIEHMGFDWDFRTAEADTVLMLPADDTGDYYDLVSEGTPDAVRYWRFKW